MDGLSSLSLPLSLGMHYPAFISLIGHKVVEDSRTKFIGIANAGSHLGYVPSITSLLST